MARHHDITPSRPTERAVLFAPLAAALLVSLLACSGDCEGDELAWNEPAPMPRLLGFAGPPLEGLSTQSHTLELELDFSGVDLGPHFSEGDYRLGFYFTVDDDHLSGTHRFDSVEDWPGATLARTGPRQFTLTITPTFSDMCVWITPSILAQHDGAIHDEEQLPHQQRRICFWGEVPAQSAEIPQGEIRLRPGERRPMALFPRWSGRLLDEEIKLDDSNWQPTKWVDRPVLEAGQAEVNLEAAGTGVVQIEPGPVIVAQAPGEELLTVETTAGDSELYRYQVRVVVEEGPLLEAPSLGVHAVQRYPRYAGASMKNSLGEGSVALSRLELPGDEEARSRQELLGEDGAPMALFHVHGNRESHETIYGRRHLVLARWTGSGFGFEQVSQPWDHAEEAALVESDGRLWTVYGRSNPIEGLVIAHRPVDGGPRDWQHQPVHPTSGDILDATPGVRVDLRWAWETNGTSPVRDFDVMAREGGGVWIGLQHVLEVHDPAVDDFSGAFVEVLRLIEVAGDGTTTFHDLAAHRGDRLTSANPELRRLHLLAPTAPGQPPRVQTVFPRPADDSGEVQVWERSAASWEPGPAPAEEGPAVVPTPGRDGYEVIQQGWLSQPTAGDFWRVDHDERNDVFGWLYHVQHQPDFPGMLLPDGARLIASSPVTDAAGVSWWLLGDGLYTSAAAGDWQKVAQTAALPAEEPRVLWPHDGALWMQAGSAIHRSTDGGTSWTKLADSGFARPQHALQLPGGAILMTGHSGVRTEPWELVVLPDPLAQGATFESIALSGSQKPPLDADLRLLHDVDAGLVWLVAGHDKSVSRAGIDDQSLTERQPWRRISITHRGRTAAAELTAKTAALLQSGVLVVFERFGAADTFFAALNLNTGVFAEDTLPPLWSNPLVPPVQLAGGGLAMAHARWVPGLGWRAALATTTDGLTWRPVADLAPHGGAQQVATGLWSSGGGALHVAIGDDLMAHGPLLGLERHPQEPGQLERRVGVVEVQVP